MAHPWSSGAAAWASTWLLGVQPSTAGFADVLIAPHLAGSMSGVRGAVPTPRGPVVVNVITATNALPAVVNITLPVGVTGRCRLSRVLLERLGLLAMCEQPLLLKVTLNGSPVQAVFTNTDGPIDHCTSLPATTAYIDLVEGANVLLLQSNSPPQSMMYPFPFPPAAFPTTFNRDELTSGNWIGTYGQDGYALFSYGMFFTFLHSIGCILGFAFILFVC